MDAPPAVPKPCCVYDEPGGKHCALCKSRHYCSKKCQVVDWKRGHKAQCRQMAAEFQDRLLDTLMPAKKPKEEPAIVEDASPADGAKTRLSAVRAVETAEANPPSDDASGWRGICAICLDLLPFGVDTTFYDCCCKKICTACSRKWVQYDTRCPLCRAPVSMSDAERLRRMQKHVDKGNAEAQIMLGGMYLDGGMGLQQNFKRAVELFERAAAQGDPEAQTRLGICYESGNGVKINFKAAALWYRRAAEQGFPHAQYCLGVMFLDGHGVAQSYDEAARWWRLAGAQGHALALYNLGACHENGLGAPQDDDEALRFFKRAAATGHAGAAARVEVISGRL